MGNSVIYRPAYDAEVEYLESDGNSYIDTGLKASSELGILAHIQALANPLWLFGGSNGYGNKAFSFVFYNAPGASYRYGKEVIELSGLSLNTTYEFDNTQNHNVMKVGSLTFTATASTFTSDYNFYLFTENRNGTPNDASSGVRIYDFKIYQNSTLIRDFIPVRIGSIGYMYDKVTKQLFANKGTGNFILGNDVSNAVIPQQRCVLYFGNQRSVGFERIYEEYEWLCGDGTKYIRIKGYTRNEHWTIRTKCRVRGAGGFDSYPEIYGASYYSGIYGAWSLFTLKDVKTIAARASSLSSYHDNYFDYNYNDVVSIIDEHNSVSINNISKSTIAGRVYFDNDEFWLFSTFDNKYSTANPNRRIADADISNFTITGNGTTVLDLIPCKLLQSIPAILDGNGIAREAGECGMWDKVSNRFYGNVANSGTFTVKGPKCYEEYDTLLMDNGGATIPSGGSYFILSNDISLTNKVFTVNLGDTYRDLIIFGDTVDGSTYMIIIYTYSSGSITIQERYGDNNIIGTITAYSSKIVILDFQNNVATVGTQQFNIQGTGYKFSGNATIYWSGIKYLKNITVDNELNLIPCKLTHGIPASMDANGIARPAGTCGMWDKVNDKFYGNVANRGSFTVSND